ncbi:Expansin-like [Melia azedarach]|uniref:Expansin-like n=1 Tax=Melia azedarach TaxID=155640 RepID=A0ACC1Y1D5_MELAZ|nr:Expansin-like [Melia azedarach]
MFPLKLKRAIFLHFLFFLLSFATAELIDCTQCEHKGKISYISEDSALSSGACAYGSMALGFNHGYLAAASFYADGALCGGCYRMRCKNKRLCKKEGTTVMVTDELTNNNSSKIDFALSRKAYMAMANKGMEKELLKHGTIHVTYKRYPCDDFTNKNLSLRVDESSKWPNHLAVKVLYQGGQTEIRDIWLSQLGSSDLISLTRNRSAVWEADNVPRGPFKFEFEVIDRDDSSSIFTEKVLPADWKPGTIYDTGVQVREYSSEACSEDNCNLDDW